MPTIDEECVVLGREYAAANLRLDLRAPSQFIQAYKGYRGPKKRVDDYFQKKLLGLRLNAIKRGYIVDSKVTAKTLDEITWKYCLVSLETFTFSGHKPTDASVDRLINEGTYAIGNLAMFTQRVNRAKGEKTFFDVIKIMRTGEGAGDLSILEWMRLASLMYGAWNAHTDGRDRYLVPLCTFPGPLTVKTTSQITQIFILRACIEQQPEVSLDKWCEITEQAGQPRSLFFQFLEPLRSAIETEEYLPESWLAEGVYDGFVKWYQACRDVIATNLDVLHPKMETTAIDEMVQSWNRPNQKSSNLKGSS